MGILYFFLRRSRNCTYSQKSFSYIFDNPLSEREGAGKFHICQLLSFFSRIKDWKKWQTQSPHFKPLLDRLKFLREKESRLHLEIKKYVFLLRLKMEKCYRFVPVIWHFGPGSFRLGSHYCELHVDSHRFTHPGAATKCTAEESYASLAPFQVWIQPKIET